MIKIELISAVCMFLVPPIVVFLFRSKVLSAIVGILSFWGFWAATGVWAISDPQYDGMGAGIAIIFGWVFALPYVIVCLGIRLIIDTLRNRTEKNEKNWNTDQKEKTEDKTLKT